MSALGSSGLESLLSVGKLGVNPGFNFEGEHQDWLVDLRVVAWRVPYPWSSPQSLLALADLLDVSVTSTRPAAGSVFAWDGDWQPLTSPQVTMAFIFRFPDSSGNSRV